MLGLPRTRTSVDKAPFPGFLGGAIHVLSFLP